MIWKIETKYDVPRVPLHIFMLTYFGAVGILKLKDVQLVENFLRFREKACQKKI
jgi:hypothetical protein